MDSVSIDVLRGEDYINWLKEVHNDRPHISMYTLRMKLAVTFGVTASNDTVCAFALLGPRPGVGKRLRARTSPDAPVVAAVLHISP